MSTHFTYFFILIIALAGPLMLSFDKRVAFYKNWKFLFPAMIIPAVCYIGWDVYFTSEGVWSFNENYITGIKLFNLPLEEVLFFFIVPYCCVFIYACVGRYIPGVKNSRIADILLKGAAIILGVTGIIFLQKHYTSWTFILNAVFIFSIYLFRSYFSIFDAGSFLISWLIILFPFLIVNGFLTAIPVVRYNHLENLGIRIYSIPLEDLFYGMLLVLMNIVIYEKLKNS